MNRRDAWNARLTIVALLALAVAAPAAAATSRLAGRVIDTDTQRPIEGALVELANVSGGQGFHRDRTDGRGAFTLDDVSSDRYYALTVSADGYADFVIAGWQIPAAQRAAELLIPLERAGVLVVRATRSDGRTPVANARVQVQTERGNAWWEGYRPPPAPRFTDANGEARFEGLSAGFYGATVTAEGLRAGEARRLAVRRGETTNAPIRLVRPASLAGVVRLAGGEPVAGVTVIARGPSEQVATTDADGAFVLSDLVPGRFRIEASHEGFEPAALRDPVAVREGESRELAALNVRPRAAEMAFVLEREAFLPDRAPRLGFRSFRVDQADLTLWVIPSAELLNPNGDFRRFALGRDTTGLTAPMRWQHSVPAGAPWSWREEELALPTALPAGAYLLRASSGDLERRVIFFVTDLGALVKRSRGQSWVSVATLRGGQPVANASVFLIRQPVPPSTNRPDRGMRGGTHDDAMRAAEPPRAEERRQDGPDWATALAEARRESQRTNGDGVARFSGTGTGERVRFVVVSEAHGVAVVDAPIAPGAVSGGDQAYVYTDRPVYRPGHVVNWKLFARRATPDGGWALPDVTRAEVTATGPDGVAVPIDPRALSPRGSADGTFTLPADVALGDWTLTARAGNAASTATFAVLEYRKPEFAVEVVPDRAVYVSGDEVRFRVSATYFFGAPVFGATVRYNLFETRLASGDEDPWSDDFDGFATEGGAGYGRVLKTGETRTDVDGRAEVTLAPERVPYDRRLTLEVEVIDPSNRVVSARGSAVMGRGLFTLSVRPTAWVVPVGRPVPIEIVARDHAGEPVVAAVTVEIDQEAWNPIERRHVRASRPLASQVVTTDSLGRARVALTPRPARAGRFILRARATDTKGNRITAESWAWAFDERLATYAYRYPALEAFADRARYAPGDTARVLVNTDVKDAAAIVAVEGRELFDARIERLSGNSGVVTVPIRADHAPNVFVTVHVRKGMEVHTRTVELQIQAVPRDLRIELAADRASYRPGDSASVHVRTRDAAGRPAAAEVSVAVVDEALFSIRPDRTPAPRDVFYGRRPNWVTTAVSFPALYYGGVNKGDAGDVRRDFRDVAHWEPALITDARGEGAVRFRWPDNLTTWRITSRGMTHDTQVGQAIARTLVTKDVVARIATPRFLVAGDRAAMVSVTTNRTGEALVNVEESLAASGVAIEGETSRRTQIAPRGESRGEWTVVAPTAGRDADLADAVFTFRARARADADALEVRVPVRPRAVPLLSSGASVAEGRNSTIAVPLPADLVRSGSRVTLDFAPSPAAMTLDAVQALVEYPYGCTEQTANTILPAVRLMDALRKNGMTAPGWEEPAAKLAPSIRRLIATQKPDGGWGWFPEGETDPWLTVLAIDAIARASVAGLAPAGADEALNRAVFAFPRVFEAARTPDAEAYVLAHLAPMLAIPEAANRFAGLRERLETIGLALTSSPDALGTAGLALAVQGHVALGKRAEGAALLDALVARASRDAGGVYWKADPGMEWWWGQELSNTGHALAALVALRPDDPRTIQTVQWLARRRTGPGWRSTRESAPVAIGLADFVASRPEELRVQARVRVRWNGDAVLDRAFGREDVFAAPLHVVLEGRALRPGENRVTIEKEGAGVLYASWTARAMVPSPGPPASPDAGLAIRREYLRAERTTDRRGRPRVLATALAPGEPLRVGETMMVRLTLTAREDLRYLVIEDPRIAGFEIDGLLPEGAEWPYGTHAEERDDRAVFFVERLDAGDTVIEYLVRPEIGGRFTALPASAAGMYEPERIARSGDATVNVEVKR